VAKTHTHTHTHAHSVACNLPASQHSLTASSEFLAYLQ
jgi:hypothetical protein